MFSALMQLMLEGGPGEELGDVSAPAKKRTILRGIEKNLLGKIERELNNKH